LEIISFLSAWSRLSPLAKPSPVILFHWLLSSHYNLYILPNTSVCLRYFCLLTNVHGQLLNILPWYFSKQNSRSNNVKNVVEMHWLILFNVFLILLFLLGSIVLTVINTSSGLFLDHHGGQIDPGTFGGVLESSCAGVSESSMPLSRSMSESLCTSQSRSLPFGWS